MNTSTAQETFKQILVQNMLVKFRMATYYFEPGGTLDQYRQHQIHQAQVIRALSDVLQAGSNLLEDGAELASIVPDPRLKIPAKIVSRIAQKPGSVLKSMYLLRSLRLDRRMLSLQSNIRVFATIAEDEAAFRMTANKVAEKLAFRFRYCFERLANEPDGVGALAKFFVDAMLETYGKQSGDTVADRLFKSAVPEPGHALFFEHNGHGLHKRLATKDPALDRKWTIEGLVHRAANQYRNEEVFIRTGRKKTNWKKKDRSEKYPNKFFDNRDVFYRQRFYTSRDAVRAEKVAQVVLAKIKRHRTDFSAYPNCMSVLKMTVRDTLLRTYHAEHVLVPNTVKLQTLAAKIVGKALTSLIGHDGRYHFKIVNDGLAEIVRDVCMAEIASAGKKAVIDPAQLSCGACAA